MSTVVKVEPLRIVHVKVPSQTFHHLDKMQAVTKEVLGRLGCLGCHSGFDIRFIQEVEFTVAADGKLHEGVITH